MAGWASAYLEAIEDVLGGPRGLHHDRLYGASPDGAERHYIIAPPNAPGARIETIEGKPDA